MVWSANCKRNIILSPDHLITYVSVLLIFPGTSSSSFAFNMPAEDSLMEPRSSSTPMLVDYNELDFTFARPATPKPHSGNVSRTNGKGAYINDVTQNSRNL
jgi:hypothetical protein